jgi:hypothetical protein
LEGQALVASTFVEVKKLFSMLSNKEAREVMTLVGSTMNLRVIPMDRPIGQAIVVASPGNPRRLPMKGSATAQPEAKWKRDSRWVEISTRHKALVQSLKSAKADEKAGFLSALRIVEIEMKELRESLRSFRPGASQ